MKKSLVVYEEHDDEDLHIFIFSGYVNKPNRFSRIMLFWLQYMDTGFWTPDYDNNM